MSMILVLFALICVPICCGQWQRERPQIHPICLQPPRNPRCFQQNHYRTYRWYFDVRSARCFVFLDNGCDTSRNRFDSRQHCQQFCTTTVQFASKLPKNCLQVQQDIIDILIRVWNSGRQNLNAYIPQCEHNGNYMATQCHAGQCWCVNEVSGQEIAGSRVLLAGNAAKPQCGRRNSTPFQPTEPQPMDGSPCLPNDEVDAPGDVSNMQSCAELTNGCPAGYHCFMGPFFPHCCGEATRRRNQLKPRF